MREAEQKVLLTEPIHRKVQVLASTLSFTVTLQSGLIDLLDQWFAQVWTRTSVRDGCPWLNSWIRNRYIIEDSLRPYTENRTILSLFIPCVWSDYRNLVTLAILTTLFPFFSSKRIDLTLRTSHTTSLRSPSLTLSNQCQLLTETKPLVTLISRRSIRRCIGL